MDKHVFLMSLACFTCMQHWLCVGWATCILLNGFVACCVHSTCGADCGQLWWCPGHPRSHLVFPLVHGCECVCGPTAHKVRCSNTCIHGAPRLAVGRFVAHSFLCMHVLHIGMLDLVSQFLGTQLFSYGAACAWYDLKDAGCVFSAAEPVPRHICKLHFKP